MILVQRSEPPAKRVALGLNAGIGTLGLRRGLLVARNLIPPRHAFRIPFADFKVKVGGL